MASLDALAGVRPSTRPGLFPAFLFLSVLVLGGRAPAQSPPAVPELGPSRLYLVDTPDQFESVRSRLEQLNRDGGPDYRVVVAGSTGTGPTATRDYLKRIDQDWTRQARERSLDYQPSQSILVVLGLANRQIAVQAGENYQRRLGLVGTIIDRDLVKPAFVPRARSGQFAEGLTDLLQAIDGWLNTRETEVAARERTERNQAETALTDARQAVEETERLAAERRAEGFETARVDRALGSARQTIATLPQQLERNPAQVRQTAQRLRDGLQPTITLLRGMPAQESQASEGFREAETRARELQASLKSIFDLPGIGPSVKTAYDQVVAQLDSLRPLVGKEPDKVVAALPGISETLARLAELPKNASRYSQLSQSWGLLEGQAENALRLASESGIPVDDYEDKLDGIRETIIPLLSPGSVPDDAAINTMNQQTTLAQGLVRQVDEARAQRDFTLKTLPWLGLGLLLLFAGLVVALFRVVRGRARKKVDDRFKAYRTRATQVMEHLDSIKERHKLLPVSDPDYQAPMAGATAGLYSQIQADLRTLWDRWLSVMDTLERAEKLMHSDSGSAMKALEEAETLLKNEKLFQDLDDEANHCIARLDQLEKAHEVAHVAADAAAKAEADARARVAEVSKAGLPDEPFEADLAALTAGRAKADPALTADPLGTTTVYQALAKQAEAVRHRAEDVLKQLERGRGLDTGVQDAEHLAKARRAEGFRLDEEGGNPDPPLAMARESRRRAADSLEQAEASAASRHLDQGEAMVKQAKQSVESVVAAREFVEREQSRIAREQPRLRELLRAATDAEARLNRDFAAESWQSVAGASEHVRALLEEADQNLAQAADDATPTRQRYLSARRLLEQAAQHQAESSQLLGQVQETLDSLNKLREQCLAERRSWADVGLQVGEFLTRNEPAIGSEARTAFDTAQQALRAALTQMDQPRPNWAEARARASEAMEEFKIARERAQDDVEAYRRLSGKLQETQAQASRVSSLLLGQEKDRLAANQRLQAATAALQQIDREASAPHANWARLERLLADATADLARAEQLAQEDERLANQAIAEISETDRAFRQARTFSSMGYSPDLSAGETQLNLARQALQRQDYEQAIQLANTAERSIRQAYGTAADQARSREWQVNTGRRRRGLPIEPGPSMGRGISVGDILPGIAGAAMEAARQAAEQAARSSRPRGGSMHLADTGSSSPKPKNPAPSITEGGTSQTSW